MNIQICTSLEKIKKDAEEIRERTDAIGGLKNVFCVACGGSLGSLYPLEYLLRCESATLHCESISSNEFVFAPPKRLGKDSVIILLSASGGTPETCTAAKKASEAGAIVISMSSNEKAALFENADYQWVSFHDAFESATFALTDSCQALYFGFELLRMYDNYAHYEEAQRAFEVLPIVHHRAMRTIDRRIVPFGEAHKSDKVIYTVASGASYSAAYMESICLIMEMEWVNSFAIHAGEMFHGPFEIADGNTPFMLFMSNGRTRKLDERALRFLQRYSGRVTVIDANELGVSILGDNVEEFFSGIINWVAAFAYGKGLALAKDHPIREWRYMKKIAY